MARSDYYLKIDGIKGESLDDKHKDEIEILSFSFGATNAGSGGVGSGHGTGRVNIHDIHFTKNHDLSSPSLFQHCCTGKHIPNALLTLRKAGDKPLEYLKIKLSDIIVSSFQTTAHGEQDPYPKDEFTLNYAKIEKEYTKQDQKGGAAGVAKMMYNQKANVASAG